LISNNELLVRLQKNDPDDLADLIDSVRKTILEVPVTSGSATGVPEIAHQMAIMAEVDRLKGTSYLSDFKTKILDKAVVTSEFDTAIQSEIPKLITQLQEHWTSAIVDGVSVGTNHPSMINMFNKLKAGQLADNDLTKFMTTYEKAFDKADQVRDQIKVLRNDLS